MAEERTNRLVTRDEKRSYYEIGENYHEMGEGFTTLSESNGAKEYSRKYVNMKTEVTDVIGYATSLSYSVDVYSQDPVITDICDIHDSEKLGTDTHRNITTVNYWQQGATPGTYRASCRTYAVVPDASADGTEALIYSGTFKAVSDIVSGSWNESTKTFVPDNGKLTD